MFVVFVPPASHPSFSFRQSVRFQWLRRQPRTHCPHRSEHHRRIPGISRDLKTFGLKHLSINDISDTAILLSITLTEIQAMWRWVISPFYHFCSFWSVAVNIVYKLQCLHLLISHIQSLNFVSNGFLMKLFQTTDKNRPTVKDCQKYFSVSLSSSLIEKRTENSWKNE